MGFVQVMEYIVRGFEIVGVGVLALGFLLGVVRGAAARGRSGPGLGAYEVVRRVFGRSILLSLEILVAADIIRTVTVETTLENMLVLGLLVVIRTFLSISLGIELEGIAPWRRWRLARPAAEAGAAGGDEAARG